MRRRTYRDNLHVLGELRCFQSLQLEIDSFALRFGRSRLQLEIQVQQRLSFLRGGRRLELLRRLLDPKRIDLADDAGQLLCPPQRA
jgi:hypothetical protein